MGIQLADSLRNAIIDRFEGVVPSPPWLDIRTGGQPADTTLNDSGDELVHMQLPDDWLNDAVSGTKTMKGTWTAVAQDGGTAGHFRLKSANDFTCYMQGNITATDGGGDMELDNVSIQNGDNVTVSTSSLTFGNE